jgi:hypothetical protein
MNINCLSCGHKFDLGDAYDDFEGQVKCYVCGNTMKIRTLEGSVKSARVIEEAAHTAGLATK